MTPDQIVEREKRRQSGRGQENVLTPQAIVAREKSRQANSATGGLYVGRDIQPDRASKVISLADRMNAQPDFVDTHLDELEQGEEEHKRNTLFSELPKLAKHFSDPYRAAESKDSIPNFAEIERAYIARRKAERGNPLVNNPFVSIPRSMLGEGVRMFGSGARGAGDLVGAYVNTMRSGADMVPGLREGLAELDRIEAEIAPGAAQFAPQNYLRTAGGGVAELGEIIAPDEQSIADRVAGALGQIVGAVGMTLVAGPGATAGLFAGQGADQQGQALRRVGISPDERPLELASGASVTALTEAMRLSSIMRALPREARDRVASNAFARIAGQAGEEAVQESAEGVLQNLITTTFDEDAGVFDGILEQAGTAGTAAAIFQALVEVALPGRSRGQQAEKAAQELQDIRDIIEQAPVFQRSREAVEAFLNEAGEGEQVILHGEDLVELYQSDPEVFMQRMDEVGLTEADIERAMNGEDVEADAAKILSVQEGFEDWVKIVKRAPEIPSLREMEREVEASDAVNAVDFRDAFERFNEQEQSLEGFERVQAAVTEQLLGAGRGRAEAEAAGAVWGAIFRQFAEAGVDEGAVFDRLGLAVNPKAEPRIAKPKEPQTLHGFVRSLGGIREAFGEDGAGFMRGEIDARIGRRVPGLINNNSGTTLDEIFRAATEEGGFEIRDTQELLDLLEQDLSGSRVYPVGEAEVYAAELEAYEVQFTDPKSQVELKARHLEEREALEAEFADIGELEALARAAEAKTIARRNGEEVAETTPEEASAASQLDERKTELDARRTELLRRQLVEKRSLKDGGNLLNQATEAGYEGQDRGEAAEWLAASRKGLDMSQEARMARAREMGFDTETVYYHATTGDIKELKAPVQDIGFHVGTVAQANNRNAVSSENIGELQGAVIPVYVRGQKFLRMFDHTSWEPNTLARSLEREGITISPERMQLIDWNGDLKTEMTRPAIVAELKAQGYDGIVYKNIWEGDGPRVDPNDMSTIIEPDAQEDSYVIFDPSNIRSVNAAFDPAQSDSSNLLHQDPPRSLFAAIKMDPQDRADWYDRIIEEKQVGRKTLLTIKADTKNRIFDDVVIVIDNAINVEFTADGMHANRYSDPTPEDIAKGARVMAMSTAALQEWMLRNDSPFVGFTGATEAHNRLYESMLGRFDFEGYLGYKTENYRSYVNVNADGSKQADGEPYVSGIGFMIVKDGYLEQAKHFLKSREDGLNVAPRPAGGGVVKNFGTTIPIERRSGRVGSPDRGGNSDGRGSGASGDGQTVSGSDVSLTPIGPRQGELFQGNLDRIAAGRFNGRVVTGWNDHESVLAELDEMFETKVPRDQVELGFVGSDGRFVSRTDRGLLLDLLNNGQLVPEAELLARRSIRSGESFTITAEMITDPLFQRQGNKPRGSVLIPGEGVLSDRDVIVRLNSAKDKSTFMHESAHIFLELYQALESENEAIAERMAAIRKWLKMEPGAKPTRAQHEKFAESFEAYLREGVAPNAELRAVFDRFRQWITDVYRQLRGQLRNLEPEARDIFDRMLATEAEIEMAQGQYVGTLSKVMQSIMSPEQVEKYAKHARKAGAVARDKLFKKHMAEVKRREKNAYKEERDRVEDIARQQLMEWPEYKALAAFVEGGRSLDASIAPEGTKLNTSENGEHPEIAASEMGFPSADAMFKAVEKAGAFDRVLKGAVDKIMGDKYGDMLRDGTIEAEAMEAVFNEPTIRMMEAERNALAEKAAGQAIPLIAIRHEADRRINELPIDKVIKPGTYAITARNLHKKALRAAARGKWDDALRYTHQAMLQHEMARRAFKAREEIDKANRFLAKFAAHRKLDPKKIAPAYITKIRELMSLPGAQGSGDIIKALNEFADTQADNGYSVVLPSEVVAGNDLPLRRRMTLEQFREFRDAVKNLNKLGRQQSEEAMQAFRAEAQELADEITQNYTGKQKRETRNPSRLEKFTSTLRNFDALFMRWPFLIEALQGGKAGKIVEAFETPLRQALQDRNARREDMTDRLKDVLKKHKITQGELNRRVNAPVIEDGNVRFGQILAVALNMGTDQNRDRLVSDPSINGDMAAIEAMLEEHLEQRHWDAAQDIWDLLDTMWADASAVEYRETGVAPKKVEASSVQTKFGTYRGGYYPLKYDRGFMRNTDLERQDVIEEWKQGVNGMATRASTNRGFLKERQQNVERPLRLDLTVILEHIDQVTNDIYMREPASRVSRLLQRSSIREAITRTQGKEYLKPLEEILKRSVVGTRRADNAFENLIRTGRVNGSVALLGLNVTTAMLAPISYMQTVIPRYGFAPIARGIAAYYGLGPFSMIKASKAINEKSVFMRERENTINREAHERIRKNAVQSRFGKIQGAGYWLMAFIEKHSVSGPLWMGIYNQALDQGKSEREAILEADRAVATTQGSGLELDQSVLQGGSEMDRLLTFMWGYVSNIYGIARNDITKAQNFNRVFQVFKHLILLNVAASMLEALIRDGFGDEEDPYWQNTLMLMQRNILGMVPGLSPFFSKYDSGPSSLQAGADLSQAGERFFSAGHDYFTEGELDAEAVRSGVRAAGTGLGLLFGIPGTLQIARIEKTLAEDDDPTLYEALITGPDDDN